MAIRVLQATSLFEIEPPTTGPSLSAGLEKLSAELSAYLAGLSTDEFLAPQGEAWSPAGHVRHLIKSVRAVDRGMRMPRPLLRLLFGRGGGSRDFEAVVAAYHEALAAGGQAGRYAPSNREVELEPGEWRALVMRRWSEANRDLVESLERWQEAALDRYRMPHPLLGKMTVREMLFFTLHHNAHHARRIRERR